MTERLPILNCDDCGACCRHQPLPPFVRAIDPHWATLPAGLKAEIDAVLDSPDFDDSATCLWLENGRCRHYEHRPEVCRDFEVGSAECLASRENRA